MDIDCLTQRDKAIFAIRLAEKANFYLQADNQNMVKEALSLCWKWIETESDLGEELYYFLDNEENGFTLLQEFEEDDIKIRGYRVKSTYPKMLGETTAIKPGRCYSLYLIDLSR